MNSDSVKKYVRRTFRYIVVCGIFLPINNCPYFVWFLLGAKLHNNSIIASQKSYFFTLLAEDRCPWVAFSREGPFEQ